MKISNCQVKTKCDIAGCKALATHRIENQVDGKLVLTVKDLESLERIIQKIKNVNGVHSVNRQ